MVFLVPIGARASAAAAEAEREADRHPQDLVDHGDSVEIVQTALFRPRGLSGRLYWWSVAPFHRFVFPGMLRGIASRALDAPTK